MLVTTVMEDLGYHLYITKLHKIGNLLLEKYPFAYDEINWTMWFLSNGIRNTMGFADKLHHSFRKEYPEEILFFRNIDKFKINQPKLIDYNQLDPTLNGKWGKLMDRFKNEDGDYFWNYNDLNPYPKHVNKISKKDIKNFNPIVVLKKHGKLNLVWDGNHRAFLAIKNKSKIPAVIVDYNKIDPHPNNKKMVELANEMFRWH